MSEIEARLIKRGYWVNLSQGPIMGQTITVDTGISVVVVALLAIVTSIALGHLFNIFTFVAYHLRNRTYRRQPDGLFRQQQVLLRTLPAPSSLVADAFKLWYSWRHISKNAFPRSIFLIALTIVYAIAMTIAGVFTSSVVSSTNIEVLVNSPYCTGIEEIGHTMMDAKTKVASLSYADDCYRNKTSSPSRCRIFTVPKIPFTTTFDDCPFPRMGCESPALTFDSSLLDVSDMFGLNLAKGEGVKYRRRTTCAIVSSSNRVNRIPASEVPSYYRNRPYYPYEEFLVYMMGPRTGKGDFDNVTFLQSLVDSNTTERFDMKEQRHWRSPSLASTFTPLPEMTHDNADVLLRLVNKNSVYYSATVNDILFSAHRAVVSWEVAAAMNRTWYMSDTLSTPIGCLEQFQFCAVINSIRKCSEITGLPSNVSEIGIPGLSDLQLQILQMLREVGRVYRTMATRKLQIADSLDAFGGVVLVKIPDDQWIIELTEWQYHAWAAHQIALTNIAIGINGLEPSAEDDERPLANQPRSQLCNIQKMRKTGDVANINVFAIIFTITVSSIVIALDLLLLRGLIFLERSKKALSPIIDQWIQEDVYHLQRRAYEALKEGEWIDTGKEIPVTKRDTPLPDLAAKRRTVDAKPRPEA